MADSFKRLIFKRLESVGQVSCAMTRIMRSERQAQESQKIRSDRRYVRICHSERPL